MNKKQKKDELSKLIKEQWKDKNNIVAKKDISKKKFKCSKKKVTK